MNSLLSDLRYAAREVRNRPGFTLTAVLSLALGIAATSAVFSVIYAVLLDPFPYPGADRMMEIRLTDKSGQDRFSGLNGPEIELLRQTKSLESVTAMGGWNLTTTDGDLPEDVRGMDISPEAPNHWGSTAMMGRWLIPSDAPFGQDSQAVVVLSYPFWQRYYAGDPNVVGRTLQLVHKPYKIVGVMGPRFRWGEADVYLPLKLTNDPDKYYGGSLKLKPGVTVAQANAELQPLLEQFAKETPKRYPRYIPRKSAQYRRDLRKAARAHPLFAARRGWFTLADRLRQRLDPLAGARHGAPTRVGSTRSSRRQPLADDSPVAHRVALHRRRRNSARRAAGMEEPRIHHRVAAEERLRRRIRDQDERSRSVVQHRLGLRHHDCLRPMARSSAFTP